MARFEKGHTLATGRPKGVQNRSTEQLKLTLLNIANNTLDRVEDDIERIREEDPGRALEFALKLLEFVTPRLKAMDISGQMNVDQRIHQIQVNINNNASNDKHDEDIR
jgi:hypothetical protein